MNSIVDIAKTLFVSKFSLLSPNSRIFVIVESFCLKKFTLTWFIMWTKVFLAQWWLGQWRRKSVVVSICWIYDHLNDWSPSLNFVSNFNPLVSWILYVKFGCGLISFNSSFLNTLIEEQFRILVSRLFHFVTTVLLLQEKLSNLKTRDFVALRTSFSRNVIVSQNLLKEIRGRFLIINLKVFKFNL